MVLRPVSLPFCDVKGRERRSKPVSFSLPEKERFLESKEKGAPVGVEWFQIGIRRPVFTPPPSTSPVYGRLPRRNRENPWSYPTFFRRLRGWESGRGAADWDSHCCGAGWCCIHDSLPLGGRCPSAHTGADEGGRWGLAYLSPHQSPSATARAEEDMICSGCPPDSQTPRGSLMVRPARRRGPRWRSR